MSKQKERRGRTKLHLSPIYAFIYIYACIYTDRQMHKWISAGVHVRTDTNTNARTHINTTLFTSNPDGICTKPVPWHENKI